MADSSGTVTVDGVGSRWTNGGELYVGLEGNGTLSITGGGAVSNGFGYIGCYPAAHGTVTVEGAGSTWMNSGSLGVGFYWYGSGAPGSSLTIRAGGTVSNTEGYIGSWHGGTGTVTVDGMDSTWTSSGGLSVVVGKVTVRNRAHLQVGQTLKLWSAGALDLDGGQVTCGSFDNSGGGTFNWPGGALRLSGPLAIDSNDPFGMGEAMRITPPRTLEVAGALTLGPAGALDLDGGQVTCESFDNSTGGTFNWAGGSLGFTGDLTIDSSDPFGMGTEMRITAGRTLSAANALTVGPAGTLKLEGGEVMCGAFDNIAGGTLNFTGGTLTVDGGAFEPGAGNFTLNGPGNPTLTLTGGAAATIGGELGVGWADGEEGTLNILSGSELSSVDAYIGSCNGSVGAMTVDGNGSTWMNDHLLLVGRTGTGTLTVSGGARVGNAAGLIVGEAGTATGTLTVRGAGSVLDLGGHDLYVSRYGKGTLRIEDGGRAVSGKGCIGEHAGSEGTAVVDGNGSAWECGFGVNLYVGWEGDGELAVSGGGHVVNRHGIVGYVAGSHGTVTVRGAGSHWENRINLSLACSGSGEVTVEDGGLMTSTLGLIGWDPTASGSITVKGAGSQWINDGNAHLGGYEDASGGHAGGEGSLTVQGGGRVEVGGVLKIWPGGTMALEGGSLHAGAIDHTNSGTLAFTGGELHVGTFLGDLVNDGGAICPGGSIGVMDVDGNLVLSAGSIEIELAGDGSDEALCDSIAVTGDVTLAGTLSPTWLPIDGDPNSKFGGIYSILSYGGTRSGAFDGIDCQMAAYLDTSLFADGIEYDDANGAVKIHLYDLLDGDADLDGRVARDDFHALQVGFGSPEADWFTGDFNLDGSVNFLDYLTWKANVGDAVPGAGKIPEPATMLLLLSGGLALTQRKRAWFRSG